MHYYIIKVDDENRLMGVNILSALVSYLIMNVYLPYIITHLIMLTIASFMNTPTEQHLTPFVLCSGAHHSDPAHRHPIDVLYQAVTDPLPTRRAGNKNSVPGWNDWVKDYHSRAQQSFLAWVLLENNARHGL